MRREKVLFVTLILVLMSPSSQATVDNMPAENAAGLGQVPTYQVVQNSATSDTNRFDGSWQTTVFCQDAAGALGYSFQFVSHVKDGVFHGQRGTEGKPGWFSLDGKVKPEGTSMMYGKGLTGSPPTTVGNVPNGTDFGYSVSALFEGSSGTGDRLEGRPCHLSFEKQ